MMRPWLKQFRPAVPTSLLLFLSGAMWISVGIMLNRLAYGWLAALAARGDERGLVYGGIGVTAGLVVAYFGFMHIVDKNLGRIAIMEGKRCLFSFMPWRSYLIMLIMISGGMLLRHSPLPKLYLATLYSCIGTALMLSSLRYFRVLLRHREP